MHTVLHQLVLSVQSLSDADRYLLGGAILSGLLWVFNNLNWTRTHHTVLLSFILPFLAAGFKAVLGSDAFRFNQGSDLYLVTQGLFWGVTGLIALATKAQAAVADSQSGQTERF